MYPRKSVGRVRLAGSFFNCLERRREFENLAVTLYFSSPVLCRTFSPVVDFLGTGIGTTSRMRRGFVDSFM